MDGNGRTLSPGPSSLLHHRLPRPPDGVQWIRGMDWQFVVATEVNDDVGKGYYGGQVVTARNRSPAQ